MKEIRKISIIILLIVLLSSFFGFCAGIISSNYYYSEAKSILSRLNLDLSDSEKTENIVDRSSIIPQEQAVVEVVERASPAVVSIIITKDMPVFEEYYINPFGGEFYFEIPQYRQKGTEKREIGGGSGFIVSEDGMVITNKHVVMDEDAEYTIFTNDGEKFPAQVLAKDPVQDLAVLQIKESEVNFPVVKLGDSSDLKIGQTVVAIGNALGEFRNTVSVGVISGLGRTVTASGGGIVETIDDVIQTDAAINKGNSGGPLLNLKGEVVGINTATALDAQNISFAIPVNKAKRDIEQIREEGKITYPFIGVYYTPVTKSLKEDYNLPVDYGAWVGRNSKGEKIEEAIFPGSPADKSGIRGEDIILEINDEKITLDNSLADILFKYDPGDEVSLRVLRGEEELDLQLIFSER
jgi:serine protease Do